MDASPHWLVVTLIGATLGFIVPYALKASFFLFQWFRKNYLEGTWYNYHWSYINEKPMIIKGKWIIKKGVLHKFVIKTKQHRTGLEYKGKVAIESDQLFIVFASKQHKEHPVYRFPYPIQSNCNLLYGIWLSFDHDKRITSGGAVISRKEISDENIERIMKSGFKSERGIVLNKIK